MSPFNLEDVEDHLLLQAKDLMIATMDPKIGHPLTTWIRNRFHELREREKVILRE